MYIATSNCTEYLLTDVPVNKFIYENVIVNKAQINILISFLYAILIFKRIVLSGSNAAVTGY